MATVRVISAVILCGQGFDSLSGRKVFRPLSQGRLPQIIHSVTSDATKCLGNKRETGFRKEGTTLTAVG